MCLDLIINAFLHKLRLEEKAKVQCAAAHFGPKQLKKDGALDGTDCQVVHKAGQLQTKRR